MDEKSGIERACIQAGGQKALAASLGVTPQAVSLWVAQGFAPVDRVWALAELSGLPRRELCDPGLVDLVEG